MNNYILIVFVVFLSACSTKPVAIKSAEVYSGGGENDVYVVSHGWHTGFVVPSKEMYEVIPELRNRFGDTPNIEFGWGDKGFYQAKEITSGLTIRAILWPTESVVHAVAVPEDVRKYFASSEVIRLCMNDNELSLLTEFIAGSFYKNDAGRVEKLRNGIYGDSQFYKGVGSYYMTNTCNTWTAKGLKSIGMNISTTLKLTSGSVMGYLAKEKLALSGVVESGMIHQCSVMENTL